MLDIEKLSSEEKYGQAIYNTMMKLFFTNRDTGPIELTDTISFGRVEGDLLFPEDDVVSTRHGKFVVEGEKTFLYDNASTNGTFLNQVQVPAKQKIELQEGDEIRFGKQILVFTFQDDLSSDIPKEVRSAKSGKELLAQAKKNKVAKVQELEQKITQTRSALQKLHDDLKSISSKLALADQAIAEIDKRYTDASSEATRLDTDKENIRKTFEEKKRPIYSRQATAQDKLKLLEMAQAPEDQKIPLKEELKKIQDELTYIDNEKKNLPQKIIDLQKKCEVLQAKRTEYTAQREKLAQALSEREAKYAPEIERMDDEILAMEGSLLKAKENLAK